MDLGLLIAQYGYFAVLLGAFIEGETVLLLAGFAAHRGYLDLGAVIGVAWVGALLGDQGYFWLGRRQGPALLRRFPGLLARTARALPLVEANPAKVILGMRFLWGLRIALPVALGMSRVSWQRYTLLNAAAAAVWAVAVALLGYWFGAVVTRFFHRIQDVEHWLMLGIIVVALLLHLLMRRRAPAGA